MILTKEEPKRLSKEEWSMSHLNELLQEAVNLEFWTIPFYMSAMYSIKKRAPKEHTPESMSADPYQLIRTVVNQEMLHLQCASNIANAFGLSPTFDAPKYEGTTVPYLDFSKDKPEVVDSYLPYSAEIGPLDEQRINAMCLIEIPEWDEKDDVVLYDNVNSYGSIGELYQALRYGAELLKDEIKGGIKQVDFFSAFYRNMPDMKITESGQAGFNQVDLLIDLITDQGEGPSKQDPHIPETFQNTADDVQPEDDHFEKFNEIKNGTLPETFVAKPVSEYTEHDKELEQILIEQFTALREALRQLFNGENPQDFFVIMSSVGASIRNCWENGVTPKFS